MCIPRQIFGGNALWIFFLSLAFAPDTLARDLRLLCAPGSGYALRSARLFDMFPRTAHFETLCVLERKPAG